MSDHRPDKSETPVLLGTLIERWRSQQIAAGQYSVEVPDPHDPACAYSEGEADALGKCADELEAAIARLPREEIQKDVRFLDELSARLSALPPAPSQAQEPPVRVELPKASVQGFDKLFKKLGDILENKS